MSSTNRPRLFLLDGSSLLYRAYYALLRGGRGADGASSFRTRDGRPTGAIYGFLNTVRKLLAEHKPDFLGLTFDIGRSSARHEAYADYKANRKPMPEDLKAQLPAVREVASALGIPVVVDDQNEADDVLGTLARRAEEHGFEVVIVTSDKDMYQLLGEHVTMLQVRTVTRFVAVDDVPELFGARVDQVIDLLALKGDASDNIPGVRGIGDKGARALLKAYDSLDGIYRNLEQLPPGQAKRLLDGEEDARLSRQLATIRTDLDLPFDIDGLKCRGEDRRALLALAMEYEFKALVTELTPPPEPLEVTTVTVRTPSAVSKLATELAAEPRIAIELADPTGADDATPGLVFAFRPRQAYFVPYGEDEAAVLEALRPALEADAPRKLGTDLKSVVSHLARRGIEPSGIDADVVLLAYLLDPESNPRDIDALARTRLERRLTAHAEADGRAAAFGDLFASLDEAAAACERADVALDLAPLLRADLDQHGLTKLHDEVERPLLRVLAHMEQTGVRIDVELLAEIADEIRARSHELTGRIHAAAGTEFNVGSPKQLADVLFERLELPVVKKTRKGGVPSTDNEVLAELAAEHELPRLVLEHRELSKLLGTYVDALPKMVRKATGRIHTTFNQSVTATGRLSSSDPNLQNIPIRTAEGRRVRQAFIAGEGRALVVADYSQIELRLLAHLSADPELVAAFAAGDDVHRRTAAKMFDVAEALVTAELRRRAKVINFGIIYGMSAYGLGRELSIAPREAKGLIEVYFEQYAGVRQWLDATIETARKDGLVRTLLGRIRYLPEIAAPNRVRREYAERTAVNTPIQGTAADLIKVAMLEVENELRKSHPSARLLLQVHDELVIEADASEAHEVAALTQRSMRGVHRLDVPLEVSIGIGSNWLEAK